MKQTLTIPFAIFLLFNTIMGLSFLFPGNFKNVDRFRLAIQSNVVSEMWCVTIGSNDNINLDAKKEIRSNIRDFKPASLVFISNRNCLGELFVKGEWKHLAIYLGTKSQIEKTFGSGSEILDMLLPYYVYGDEILILDSSSDGVTIREINKLLKPHLKAIAVYEMNINNTRLKDFILSSFTHLGKKYDYDIQTKNKSSLYCSELIYYSLQEIGINILAEDVFVNRKYISPTSILKFIKDNDLSANEYVYKVNKTFEKQKIEFVNKSTGD